MDDKVKEMLTDFKFKQSVFKQVLDNKSGRLIIDYLDALYDTADNINNIGNVHGTYFALGKRRAVKEIRDIVNSEIKKKKD